MFNYTTVELSSDELVIVNLSVILQGVGKDKANLPLSSMKDLQKTNKLLDEMNEEKHYLQTLQYFVDAKDLVHWLKENIRGMSLSISVLAL